MERPFSWLVRLAETLSTFVTHECCFWHCFYGRKQLKMSEKKVIQSKF